MAKKKGEKRAKIAEERRESGEDRE